MLKCHESDIFFPLISDYPLVNIQKTSKNYGKSQFFMGKSPFFIGKSLFFMGKSQFFMGKSTISMAVFQFAKCW